MIKMAAATKTSPQQSEVGMLSITGWGAIAGAIVTGAVGGVTGVAVKVKSGCVLDIFIGAGFGGSGRILMRAVSLANGVVGAAAGAGAAAGGAGAAAAVPMGRGTGVLAAGSGGGGTAAGGGGGGANVRGTGTLATGGLGNGTCDTGGRGIGTLPGFGASGVGGGSDVGGRAGRLIRTISSSCGATASPRRGGRVIRTVSFFGWLASAMVTLTGGKIRLPKIGYVVTGKLRSLGKRWCLHRGSFHFCVFRVFHARPTIGVMKYWSGDILRQPDSYLN
jgi:hypothetical protein